MSTSKLHIFQKNTDASASLRGYQYQILKTLESWLSNLQENIDEEIYCDFEEDIFHRNQLEEKVTFRQLKLYSSNFSFKSEEIEKCISHFFMLHVKTDYKSFDKEFVFEANSNVAGKYKDNEAELLRNWVTNQDDLSDELLESCSNKSKEIVSAYINEQAKKLEDSIDEGLISEALSIFEALTKDDWVLFTKCIRWKFAGPTPEEEFEATIDNIKTLILKLPFPINEDGVDAIFGILYKEVSIKSSQKEPQDRKLTLRELEYHLLNSGSEGDQWYSGVYEKWTDVDSVENFLVGEFFEIIDASRYCRRRKYLSNHDSDWLKLLDSFIKMDLRKEFKRYAIYEFLWLKFRPDDIHKLPTGDLFGCENLIREYFENFSAFNNAKEIQDAQNLLNITFTAFLSEKVKIEKSEIRGWFKELYRTLHHKLKETKNPNEKCELLESLGTLAIFSNQRNRKNKSSKSILKYFEEILSVIDDAAFYHATTLSERINKYIELFIKIDYESNSELINSLESFSEKLDVVVRKRDGDYNSAKVQVERGVQYLRTNDKTLLLKSLDYFHKAKDLWFQQETIEGYVLAMINISQLYSAIGMNIAAKYYALGGAWVSFNNGDEKLFKRISHSLGMLFHADFQQGMWMSAIIDFHLYMKARHEFDPDPILFEKGEITLKIMADFALLLHCTPKLSPQFQVLIDFEINSLGYLGEEFINPLLGELETDYSTLDSTEKLIADRLDDLPLNEVEANCSIKFKAFGSNWEIVYPNKYEVVPIAEEFCARLQVMLAEIALSQQDFHFVKGDLRMEVVLSSQHKMPEQIASTSTYNWTVFTVYYDDPDPKKLNLHSAHNSASVMSILNEISLLPQEEFMELFKSLFEKSNLAQKALSVNAYQKMYRKLISEDEFQTQQRALFQPVNINMEYPLGAK